MIRDPSRGRAMARLRAMARGPRRGIAATRPSGLVPHRLHKIGPAAHTPPGARYPSEKKVNVAASRGRTTKRDMVTTPSLTGTRSTTRQGSPWHLASRSRRLFLYVPL